ncbi:Cobalamin synthase [Rhodovulum sp. P5]|uniref:adenosylcobinamide-GDP ribazoletransferase n=1 Tax=Rhodovulum sp. P5 TaxID=1564506 RepID=UPI0009C1E881|nr:adenosylcobinamide-GDP ribazoletransferase [Rhodovulum sp. P5]ARE40490.1 Cobalamin synthase [Rhodovulum sp. P5]
MTARLRDEAGLIRLAALFMTRLPVRVEAEYSPERMRLASAWFPLVGLGIGAVLALAYGLAALVFPPLVAALLAVALGVRLTGALHEDGLADIADGLGGAADRARAMEIMRDSRIGSYGAVALGLVLAVKVAALSHLGSAAMAGLIAAHGLSRLSPVLMMARLPYARSDGKAAFAGTGPGPRGLRIALATSGVTLLGLGLTVGPVAALVTLIALAAVLIRMEAMFRWRLGGYTGDGLGAVQQLSETAVLLAILACV